MKNQKLFNVLVPDTKIYLFIIGVMILLLGAYNLWMGLSGVLLFAYLVYHHLKIHNLKKQEWEAYLEGLFADIDSATKQAILSIPIPFSIVELDGTIHWYNRNFAEMMDEKNLFEKKRSGDYSGSPHRGVAEGE